MLELEFEDQKQFDAGDLIWYKSQEELEASGWSVFNLKLSINSLFSFDIPTPSSFNKKNGLPEFQ